MADTTAAGMSNIASTVSNVAADVQALVTANGNLIAAAIAQSAQIKTLMTEISDAGVVDATSVLQRLQDIDDAAKRATSATVAAMPEGTVAVPATTTTSTITTTTPAVSTTDSAAAKDATADAIATGPTTTTTATPPVIATDTSQPDPVKTPIGSTTA